MEHDPTNHHFNGSLILKTLLENPELLKAPEIKENKDKNVLCQYDASVAFLGPSWEKTIPFNNDEFKFEYMDLDEFLEENGIDDLHFKSPFPELNDAVSSPDGDTASSPVALSPSSQPSLEEGCTFPVTKSTTLKVVKLDEELPDDHNPSSPESSRRSSSPVDYEISPQELALATVPDIWYSQYEEIVNRVEFDPRKRTFSENELKPQPLMKKSKKIYVPDDLKDDRYWCRRNKNNVAAKRSRDARRVKENQIVLRAQFLEKENNVLKRQVDKFRKENENLLARLAKYEG